MTITANIKVEIDNIKVKDGYFSFSYLVTSGKHHFSNWYESDFDAMDDLAMRKLLKNGYAIQLALQQVSEESWE